MRTLAVLPAVLWLAACAGHPTDPAAPPIADACNAEAAQAWIGKYFDTKARVNVNALATLKQLAESPVSITPPDINASLAAARAARAAREKR